MNDNILEPTINGLPPVTDWQKVFLALQQANEAFLRGATLPELGKQIVGDVQIQGADFVDLPVAEDSTPVALPIPETGNKFGFLADGQFTQPSGGTLEYSSTQWGLTLFDGDKWVKKFTLDLPMRPLSNTVNQDTDKGITPKGVDDALGIIKTSTAQLLDKSTFVFGYYDAAGNLQTSTATIRTPKIKIKSGETKLSISNAFVLGASVLYRMFFYNTAGALLPDPNGRIASSVTNLVNLNIPTGADTWAINLVTESGLSSATNNQYSNSIMANYGETVKPYEPFGFNVVGNNISTLDTQVAANSAMFVDGVNLIDKSKVSYGYWNASGGRTTSSTTISTAKIPIQYIAGKQETISLNNSFALGITYRFVFWDKNGVFISTVGTDQPIVAVPIPTNAGLVGVNIISKTGGVGDATNNEYVNSLQLNYGSTALPFQVYGKKVVATALPISSTPGVEVSITSANAFTVTSFHDNGERVDHYWEKNNKVPQYDNAWRATEIYHSGRKIAQGSFNWIHQLAFPNEGQHVGTGHGCETLRRVNFYVDGKEFVPANSIGKMIKGTKFIFDIDSVIYAADSAATGTEPGSGSNVVPKLPLIESTYHYMIGEIGANSRTKNYNKLVINRDNTVFIRCYLAMHSAYPTYFDRLEIANIENTMNNYNQEPINGSTATLNGPSYDTYNGYRGELGQRVMAYSDRFGYIMRTEAFSNKEIQNQNMNIYFSKNSQPDAIKGYIQPVVTTELALRRGLVADIFNKGDVLEGTVYRELNV